MSIANAAHCSMMGGGKRALDYVQDGLVYINNPENPYFDGTRFIQDTVPEFTTMVANPFTIEFCANLILPTGTNNLGTVFQFNNNVTQNALYMAYNGIQGNNKNCINWVCFQYLFGRWGIDNIGFSEFGKFKTMGFQYTAQKTLNVFSNGTQTFSNFKGNGYSWGIQNFPFSNNLFLMRGANGYSKGYLFSFRIYSRLLTQDESTYNHNVDKQNFDNV